MNTGSKPTSRRQRLYELMKTTKDVYIPTISNTISQLAAEGSRALTSDGTNNNDHDDRSVIAPRDLTGAEIEIYPHFTREVKQSIDGTEQTVFYTQTHGWVYSTTGSARKKKLVFALAKQLVKSKNASISEVTANEINEQINSINDQDSVMPDFDSRPLSSNSNISDPQSFIRRTGTSSSDASSVASSFQSQRSDTNDDVLRERISNFVNRSLGNLEITICIGGGEMDDKIKKKQVITDDNGNFNVDIPTTFKPNYIQVSTTLDERIFSIKNTIFAGNSSYGIISDIDDTIKKTGICGEKRQVFRNTFSDNITTWEIPGASDCYRFFNQQYQMPVFYVSNSPYQLYSNLIKFFEMFEFPQGSMYLKKYTGNLLNSMMEPSHIRKKHALARILTHFKDKKFFLIGDTGEQDLEAYIDISRSFPDSVQGIFLRVAEGSISKETLKTLKEILNKKDGEFIDSLEDPIPEKEDLIDLDSDVDTEHINEIKKESEEISSKVLNDSIDLEQGSTSDFFAHNKTEPGVTINSEDLNQDKEIKPKRKPPPNIPKKPDFLRSKINPNATTASNANDSKSSPDSTTKSLDTSKVVGNEPAVNLPPLPKRPIPQPPTLPPRRETIPSNNINENTTNDSTPYDEEKNDEWISRVLTSLIILKKVNPEIKLRFFIDFADVQVEIKRYVQ